MSFRDTFFSFILSHSLSLSRSTSVTLRFDSDGLTGVHRVFLSLCRMYAYNQYKPIQVREPTAATIVYNPSGDVGRVFEPWTWVIIIIIIVWICQRKRRRDGRDDGKLSRWDISERTWRNERRRERHTQKIEGGRREIDGTDVLNHNIWTKSIKTHEATSQRTMQN